MKHIILLILFLFTSTSLYAKDCWVVDKGDSVVVVYLLSGTIEEAKAKMNLSGNRSFKCGDFPDESDRDYWIANGNSVIVDEVKKRRKEQKK